jgi:hypothetical protein
MSGDLPPAHRQKRLLQHLAELLRLKGHKRFLEAPLREPSPEHFPDPWSPDARGVRSMLQRLMTYAGLGDLEVSVQMTGTKNPVHLIQETGASALHVAAWFSGLDDGTARFGYDLANVHDPDKMAGILSHEVSHAYRHYHDLADRHPGIEEGLTDLTTVFLGSGILTANIATLAPYKAGTKELSYLTALELTYLLAAQVVARGAASQPIAEKLSYSPRRYFLAASDQLAKRRAALMEELGIPLGSSRLFNEGKTVSLVPVKRWGLFTRYCCSGPNCGAPLRQEDMVCGHCGGKVSGGLERLMGLH